jgi:hypothetical protein
MTEVKLLSELDWNAVVARYANGAEIPGAASVVVTGADDAFIYVKHRLWSDRFRRKHFEKAVRLLAAGKMSRTRAVSSSNIASSPRKSARRPLRGS